MSSLARSPAGARLTSAAPDGTRCSSPTRGPRAHAERRRPDAPARPHGARARALRAGPSAFARALRARQGQPAGRRPDAVDERVGGLIPRLRGRGTRGSLHRRRRPRVRRSVPRRHRCDDRSRAEGGGRGDRRAGGQGHHAHAPDRGRGVGRRRDAAAVRPAVLAVLPDRDRREPLHDPAGPGDHGAPQDPGVQLLLPRLGRRDDPHDRGRRARTATRERRRARRSHADHARRRVQRRRGARGGARARGRRVRPCRTGPHEHRDRPARTRVPRRAPAAHARSRHVPGDRRDAHDLRRTGRGDEGLGARPGLRHDRQAARERRPGRVLRDERRGRRAHRDVHALAPDDRRRRASAGRSPATRSRWPRCGPRSSTS